MEEGRGEGDGLATVVVAALVCRCSNSKALMASSESVFGHVLNPILRGGTAKPGSTARLCLLSRPCQSMTSVQVVLLSSKELPRMVW